MSTTPARPFPNCSVRFALAGHPHGSLCLECGLGPCRVGLVQVEEEPQLIAFSELPIGDLWSLDLNGRPGCGVAKKTSRNGSLAGGEAIVMSPDELVWRVPPPETPNRERP